MAEHRRAKGRAGLKALLIAAGVVVAALVIGGGLLLLAAGDGVRPGATVAGVSIGGMSRDEAITTLEETLGKTAAEPIAVQVEDQEFDVDPATAGLAFDAAATVDQAGSRDSNPFALISSLLQATEVAPVVTVDQAALDAQLDSVALAVDVPAQEPTVDIQDGEIVTKPGSSGRALDRQALASQLQQALLEPRSPLSGTIVDSPPTIGDEALTQAEGLAQSAISRPVRVIVDGVKAKIPRNTIANALSFRAENGVLVPELNGALLHEAIADKIADLETPGRDATFEIKQGQTTVVPSHVGRGVSDEELATKVATVLGNPKGERKVEVAIGTREPKF
ncbi:MAG: peptidoglycan binding domain-containing protein, partial [Actinomycetales bacterium]